MFDAYRSAFSKRGAASFCTAGVVSRLFVGIYPLALLLLLALPTGQYGKAALVSGCWTIGNALGSPVAGMVADRFGQYKTVLLSLVAHFVLAAMMLGAVALDSSLPATLVLALLLGASVVNTGPMTRARWAALWADDTPERSAAYSVETVLDEVVFAIGPLLAAALAIEVSPYLAVASAFLLSACGGTWLLFQRRTEPLRRPPAARVNRRLAARYPGMPLLLVLLLAVGATCGSAEVLLVARTGELGDPGGAGLVLACFAVGSGVSAILYGARTRTRTAPLRLALSASAFGLLPVLYLTADSFVALMVCSAVNGLSMAPTVINAFHLLGELVPVEIQTEGMNWVWSSLSLGFGSGTAAVGRIADEMGSRATFLLPVLCALSAAATAYLLHFRLKPRFAAEELKTP
ncbi:MFS transporter [Lentzea sp. NEAU-D7]|uniref:MFS transporter n=1 Tax=Lentzea sp. NEAU-D7 TaxID=2994667 RepID=UPI00224B2AE7|nr:MFS transporter [Lentzea sp. NEAU-D7]MCX2950156.1 MFS transporter [Lentzea sp. NEAU-D7]